MGCLENLRPQDAAVLITKQQQIARELVSQEPLSLHDQLVIERGGGYKALGAGPMEPEPKKRMPYDALYLKMKRSYEGV